MSYILRVTTGREEVREAVGTVRVESVGDRVGGYQHLIFLNEHTGTEAPKTAAARDTVWRVFFE